MLLERWMDRPDRPDPWSEGEKIPWNDPEFSARMLTEHFSQDHDAASRRTGTIDAHVTWIDGELLSGRPSRILDLGCGPGLYSQRLADLGHTVVGVDYSPASIDYARRTATTGRVSYVGADIREFTSSEPFDLVMVLFGEANVFQPGELRSMLSRYGERLGRGGTILLEAHTRAAVEQIGSAANHWRSRTSSVFSDRPHLWLEESWWHDDRGCAVQRWSIVDAATAEVTCHAATTQSYSDAEYLEMLTDAGFSSVDIAAEAGPFTADDFVTIVARTAP